MNTDSLRKLWKVVFGDTDAFLDSFFTIAYSPERCKYYEQEGEAICALYWFDCTYDGGKLAYIYAVATHPDHRGKGLASRLMEETHAHLQSLGYAGAVLKPASGLFPFYERLGYQTCGYIRRFTAEAAREGAELVEISPEAYSAARPSYLPENMIDPRGGAMMDLLNSFARFYAFSGSILCVAKEDPVIFEYLGDPNLAPVFLASLGMQTTEIPTFGEDIPYAMWHPLNCAKMPGYLGISLE